ncbi:MAG: hypothetical protein R3Y46_02780 [Opitutales bacterium]
MHINPLINIVIERHINVKGKFFKYKLVGRAYGDESYIVNESLKEAFCLVLDSYMSLKNKDENSLRIATEISGSSNYQTLLSSLERVGLKILDNVLVILRENYLDTENDNVLASINKDDKKTFTVYDNFFDKVCFKENRAGIFIHEIAHLCDFDEEDEMKELDSAECIKKYQ